MTAAGLSTDQQVQLLQAAGIPVSTTVPPAGTYYVEFAPGIYVINQSSSLTDGMHGLTPAQYSFAASVTSPYTSAQSITSLASGLGVPLTGTALAPATASPTSFTPTAFTQQGSGVADPFQPVGQGFGTDYGLPTDDPNFAFGNPTGDQTIQTSGVTPAQQTGQQPLVEPPMPGSGANLTATSAAQQGNQAAAARTAVLNNQQTGTVYYPTGTGTEQAAPSSGLTALVSQQRGGTRLGATAAQPVATVPGAQPAAAPASAATGTTDQQNALTDLQTTLNTYGLGSLTNWAWTEIVNGASEAQVLLDLYQQPAFKNAYPEIAARQQAGLPPLSPADIVNYRNQATQIMKAAGLPSGFWDQPADFTALLGNDISLSELNQRVSLAQQAAYQVPADVRATLARDYGVDAGQLAAFFLDDKTALPLIQRDFTAAQIGGAAYRTGYGSTKTQDEMLTDLSVNPAQAAQGFTQLVQQRQLYSSLPGENTTGISREDQLAAQFAGNSVAQEQLQRRAAQRVAAFAGGGGFATGPSGYALGQAQSA